MERKTFAIKCSAFAGWGGREGGNVSAADDVDRVLQLAHN